MGTNTTAKSICTDGQNVFVLVVLTSPAILCQHRVHERRHKCICAGGCLKRPPAQINSYHFETLKWKIKIKKYFHILVGIYTQPPIIWNNVDGP
jgi:hypothetical protein